MTEPLLLRGGTVFDGRALLGRRDVLVADGFVIDVSTDLPAPIGTRTIDCNGHTVMPGLIDAHVHLAWAGADPPPTTEAASRSRAERNATALLRAGVTTVRDTGGPLEALAPLALELAGARTAGPDVIHCGRILCAPGGHGTEIPLTVTIARECAGPDGFRAGVREQLAGGARFIKVTLNGADGHVEVTREELTAAVEEAHAFGVGVACHASVRAAVALAIDCGVDTIEHGNGLDGELARAMAARQIALVPTVAIFGELKEQLDRGDDGLLTPEQRAAQRRAVVQRVNEHAPAIAAALDTGVTLGFGTDRVPGGDVVAVVEEAHALRRLGLTPTQVLRAATSGSADAVGLTDRGMIRPGGRADLVVFAGDVIDDLDLLEAPTLVLRGGVLQGGATWWNGERTPEHRRQHRGP